MGSFRAEKQDEKKALERWEELLGKNIPASDAAEVVEFARTQLSMVQPFSMKTHDHWERLWALFTQGMKFCSENEIFALRGR